jgi:hypothetical protein
MGCLNKYPCFSKWLGIKGYYYVVSDAGSTNIDNETDWKIKDWIVFNGLTWEKVDNTESVTSINGFTGAVDLSNTYEPKNANIQFHINTTGNPHNASTDDISEGSTNKYYTESRVSSNTDVQKGVTSYGWGNHAMQAM